MLTAQVEIYQIFVIYKSTNLLNKSSCIKGTKGNNASDKEGGKGANMANYGVGGTGGIQDTGDNANGKMQPVMHPEEAEQP